MPKWAKLLIGVVLLPFCIGEASALARVARISGSSDLVWVPFLAGAACWLVVFIKLPKPMWLYVLGHEATHAFWTWAFGGKVRKFKVTSKGGHVVTNKSNFMIVLAPYFFPFYAACVVLLFAVGQLIFPWQNVTPWFHLFLGAAFCFHATLTAYILRTRQSDITSQGYLFSAVVIWLGNLGVMLFGAAMLAKRVSVLEAASWWMHDTARVLHFLAGAL